MGRDQKQVYEGAEGIGRIAQIVHSYSRQQITITYGRPGYGHGRGKEIVSIRPRVIKSDDHVESIRRNGDQWTIEVRHLHSASGSERPHQFASFQSVASKSDR